MRRRLFTILSALSLILCVTICAEWARTYRRVDTAGWSASTLTSVWQIEILFTSGGMFLRKATITNSKSFDPLDHPYPGIFWETSDTHPLMRMGFPEKMAKWDRSFHVFGLWWATFRFSNAGSHADKVPFTGTVSMVYVQTWWIAAVLGALPVVWFIRVNRCIRRRATGRCVNCGYDVRATPDLCPECGTIPKTRQLPPTVT
jgi:hypothetical protein